MKNAHKILVALVLTAIVFIGNIMGVFAVDNDLSSATHTHEFTNYSIRSYTSLGADEHMMLLTQSRSCNLCDFEEIISQTTDVQSHSFVVTRDEHLGKTHYFSESCSKCDQVKYSGSYTCSGNPCIRPYSIKLELDQ